MDELFRAIVAHPEQDEPRLVLADYLSDRGDPRGELISLQIALSRGQVSSDAEERIYELVELAWPAITARLQEAGVQRFGMRRGFVEAVVLPAKLLGELPSLMTAMPITLVTLMGSRVDSLRLSRMPELTRLRSLGLGGLDLRNKGCTRLLRSGRLFNLETLDLSKNGLGEQSLRALVRAARHFPRLCALDLAHNRVGADAVSELLASPLARQLTSLSIDPSHIDPAMRSRARPLLDAASPPDGVLWFPRIPRGGRSRAGTGDRSGALAG